MSMQPRRRPPLRAAPRPHQVPLGHALRAGFALLEAGRLAEARHLFEQLRLSAPDHPTALTMLSVIAFRLGEDALGEAYRERAIAVYRGHLQQAPGEPGLLAPLVNLLLAKGLEREAEACSRELELALNPIRSDTAAFCARWRSARARGLPTLLLVTMPKSASETIWNRVAAGLDLPQTHLSLGLFPHCCLLASRMRQARQGGLTSKEHILPTAHNLALLWEHGIDRLVVHLRDPRQAVLSWAHFVQEDVAQRRMGAIWRSTVPPRAVLDRGFEAVLDWCIDTVLPRFVDFARAWGECAGQGGNLPRIRILTYERFLADPGDYMEVLLGHFDIPAETFDAQAAAAAASVHLRQGRVDEWRTVFTRAQRARVNRLVTAELCRRFGWQWQPSSRRNAHADSL